MEMSINNDRPLGKGRGFFRGIVDAFDSIWLGVFWIVLILIYATLGSAVPVFRQYFELTEFQYFNHWIFVTLIAMFCLTLIVTTLRRIRFNLRNLGVLTVHTGLLVLCGGGVAYFGGKIEGDVWMDAPRIRVVSIDRLQSDPQRAALASIVAVEGRSWEVTMPGLGGLHRIEVTDVRHQGLVTAAQVELKATVPGAEPQTVTLDQSTRDGVFAKLSDRIALWLTPANITDRFYDETMPVLFVQDGNHVEPFELPALPYYHERFVEAVEPIRDVHGRTVESARGTAIWPLEKWRMPIELTDPSRAVFTDWPITLTIDGYLPYARQQQDYVSGGEHLMPIARVRLSAGGETGEDWVAAQLPERSSLELASGAAVEFQWIGQATEIDPALMRSIEGRHVLEVHVRDRDIRRDYDLTVGQKIAVQGTDYSLTAEELRPNWPLMTAGFEGARTPIALVWVETPDRSYQRSVLQRYPELNQDRDRAGQRIDPEKAIVDENLELRYTDASSDRFLIVAGENLAPTLVHTAPGGAKKVEKLEIGESYASPSGAELVLADFIARPRVESRPAVIPLRNRRSFGTVRRSESLIRVHLASNDGSWSRRVWVPFSMYNTDHDPTTATVVHDVPGIGDLRLIYGRATRPLPARLSLEWLQTDFYPGRQQPSGWTSHFRQQGTDGRVVRSKAWLNNTARVGEWTLFQSQAAGDHESWTVLGVGNRQGVWTMLAGCALITLGMIYAFCVKPVLVRRRREMFAKMNDQDSTNGAERRSDGSRRRSGQAAAAPVTAMLLAAAGLVGALPASRANAAEAPAGSTAIPEAAQSLAAIQDQLDVKSLGALATQHSWRYSTVDSWARDAVKSICGSERPYGLDPVVAAFEFVFNAGVYHDRPIIYIKDKAIRKELTAHPVPISDEEQNRIIRTGMVSHDFLSTPIVARRIQELSMDSLRKTAMDRLNSALGYYENLAATCTIVPTPEGEHDTPWISLAAVDPHASSLNPDDLANRGDLFAIYVRFKRAWLDRDVDGINAGVARLGEFLPTLAPKGLYPPLERRLAEVSYRRMNIIWYGWIFYIMAFFVSIFTVATRYRWVRGLGLVLLLAAIGLHGYDLALRWNVIGRVPVANMYEAVVSSTWVGAVFALLLELILRKRVFLLAGAMLGFFALSLPELLPNVIDNKLGGMMPILDDVMLRIHTVLIISSYAVITLAFAVANCYLFVSAFRDRTRLAQGTIGAEIGAIACLGLARGGVFAEWGPSMFIFAFAACVGMGILLAIGLCRALPASRRVIAAEGPSPEFFPVKRGILAEFDLSHRVLLYTATVALFVGIILGAIWADYSWGRPWGWDPKEVFALNTWLIYVILVHVPFISRRRALVTSVLSVFGFAAMQFNWWVVNFYIVGLHSYA